MPDNINLKRYNEMNSPLKDNDSFLRKKFSARYRKFIKEHEEEYKKENEIMCAAFEKYENCEISLEELQIIKKKYDVLSKYPIQKIYIMLPIKIESWICCGFKRYNRKQKRWEHSDKVHLYSKLVRYKTWEDVNITWWDKIRFYLITGYKFQEEG